MKECLSNILLAEERGGFIAYAWDPAMTDEQLLESLLAFNVERAAAT